MIADLVIVNNPADLPWQTNLFDALMFGLFVAAVVNAIVKHRQGMRIYSFVVASGLVYGIILELAGMATLNMYLQGDFAVMINFPAIPLFAGTTAMPLYVTLFYPVIFTLGYKVVEGIGVTERWRAAASGGLFMIMLDAPYIIEGNLRHIVWWTWDSDFIMFQYWLGWPLVDMFWQSTWGATFYYLVLTARPYLDGRRVPRWSTPRALLARAPLAAVSVLVIGTVLMLPLIAVTFMTGVQWPVLVLLVAALAAITASGLRGARPPTRRIDRVTLGMATAYVVAFAAMVVGNIVHENGVPFYVVVQALGLIGVVAFVTFPMWSASISSSDDDAIPADAASTNRA